MQMYRRKEGKKKVKIGAHKGLILTLPFDSNVLVEQMVKILGKDARFIVKCPLKCNI